jgi:hypothetical protein
MLGSDLAEQSGLALVFQSEALAIDVHQGNAKLIFTATLRAEAGVAGLYMSARRDRSRYRKSLVCSEMCNL